ncbi:MAG: hypothetical protein WCB27_23440 [Thermoguttaceae bacterium]
MTDSALTPTPFPVCTRVCTSEPENANDLEAGHRDEGEGIDQGDPLAVLAAAVANLSPADRERLAVMLTGNQGDERGRESAREAQP